MADVEFDDIGAGAEPVRPHRVLRFVHLTGALTSVALVLGLGYWGYRIAVRDISGVPVVRALEGPLRVAPDPAKAGGEVTLHQGLAVNAIPEAGMAEPVADQLALAPRAGDLAEEDLPGLLAPPPLAGAVAAAAPAAAGVVTPPPALPAASSAPVIEDPEQSVAETATGEDLEAALAAAAEIAADTATEIATEIVTDTATDPGAAPDPDTADPAQSEAEPVVNPAVARSLRPPPRPAGLERVAATATESTATPGPAAPPRVVDPASLKIGARLVQLGAYDSAEAAEADWTRIATQFGELMTGKGMVVQAAQSGGRSFWRLRAEGFEDDADARRFCAALQAENATCIPVVWR